MVDFRANGQTRGLLKPIVIHGRMVTGHKAPETRTEPKPRYYSGCDGAKLATQPATHRKKWEEAQWLAFHEHKAFRGTDEKEPATATAWRIKHAHGPESEGEPEGKKTALTYLSDPR